MQINDGLNEDSNILSQQERNLDIVLPKLIEDNGRLQNEYQVLQAQADGLASCDEDELRQTREQLAAVDEDLQAKLRHVNLLEQELAAKDQGVQDAIERRDEYYAEIKEAERVRQESRGWKTSEVAALQGTLLLFPVFREGVPDDPPRRIRDRPRRNLRMENHLRLRSRPHNDLQRLPPTVLQPILFPRRYFLLYSSESRELPHQPHLHRRRPRIPTPRAHNRKTILPPNHPRTAPMSPSVRRQHGRSPRLHSEELGPLSHHRRGSPLPWHSIHHGNDYCER